MAHEIFEIPGGEVFCDRSALLDPDGSKWNVARIENYPPGSSTIKVYIMGDGNPNRSINLNEMSGWKVIIYDDHKEDLV